MPLTNFAGMQIVADPNLVVADGEDWSEVRSPARARRRRKRGFPQRIRVRYKPDPHAYRIGGRLVAHPAFIDALKREIQCQPPSAPAPWGMWLP